MELIASFQENTTNPIAFFLTTILYGIAASLVAIVVWEIVQAYLNRRRFHRLIGVYKGYGFVDDDANFLERKKDSNGTDEQQSVAEITYAGCAPLGFALTQTNILKMVVTNPPSDKYRWEGIIKMENSSLGTLVWVYTKPAELESFGAKWLIVNDKADKISVYITEFVRPTQYKKTRADEEPLKTGFGKEVFDKPKEKSRRKKS